MVSTPAERDVVAELRVLRRRSDGVTADSLTQAPTICLLLGGGDPHLAFTRLQHHLLENMNDRAMRAAAAALGMSSEGQSVLDRLEDGANELHLDQRHVRRLSDEGFQTLAVLLTTSWMVEATPALRVMIIGTADGVDVMLHTVRPAVVEMSDVTVTVYVGNEIREAELVWRDLASEQVSRRLESPIRVDRHPVLSLTAVWRGEVWPKFTCSLIGESRVAEVESLGNRLMVRFGSDCI